MGGQELPRNKSQVEDREQEGSTEGKKLLGGRLKGNLHAAYRKLVRTRRSLGALLGVCHFVFNVIPSAILSLIFGVIVVIRGPEVDGIHQHARHFCINPAKDLRSEERRVGK